MTPIQTRVLLRGEQTGGRIAMVENTVPGGWDGPPLHHHEFDETFYVLDGELTFQLGDELFTAGPGALACAPGGALHTLANLRHEPARYLLFCTPAGFERYFDRLAGAAPSGPIPETTVAGPQLGVRGEHGRATPLPAADARINVLLRGDQSGGRIALMDNFAGIGGGGPPLHHHEFDELFCMLDGELTFKLGDELVRLRAGEHAFVAGGEPHTFANLSGAPARMLIVCTPAGFERYFGRMAAEQAGEEVPEWARAPWPEVTRVGPPIAG